MASNDLDPSIVDADRRIERAKAQLRSRLAMLEHRFEEVRDRIDVVEQIRRHPMPAIGIGLALGALLGYRSARAAAGIAPARSIGTAVLAALGAVGMRIARDVALGQLSRAARRWWSEHGGPLEDDDEFVVSDDVRSPGAGDATILG